MMRRNNCNEAYQDRQLSASFHKVFLILALILSVLTACNLPLDGAAGEETGDRVGTSVARTVAARSRGEETAEDNQPPAPAATDTQGPTDTPTQLPTATLTPTPDAVTVGVTGNTFCRTGPGSLYDQRGVFNSDQTSEIIARDPTGDFWYIVNPDNPGENCWIWGNYATPVGPTDFLPVYTPPPSPTPGLAFSAELYREDGVAGGVYLWFVIQNTGGVDLESVSTTVKSQYTTAGGTVKNQTVTSTFNKFADSNLPVPPNLEKATPGEEVFTASDRNTTITSDTAAVTMTICSQNNLNGSCVTRNFTINLH
ncbi:MAG: hypothetical protein U5K99_03820 [Anaerolineales bacterium]|nr:hypothetical protein [Anaerolineales bacterium]